jgi:hypothetical protein
VQGLHLFFGGQLRSAQHGAVAPFCRWWDLASDLTLKIPCPYAWFDEFTSGGGVRYRRAACNRHLGLSISRLNGVENQNRRRRVSATGRHL